MRAMYGRASDLPAPSWSGIFGPRAAISRTARIRASPRNGNGRETYDYDSETQTLDS